MSNERPTCGLCHKTMTPRNSTKISELFVCDDCAPQIIGVAPANWTDDEWSASMRYADEHADDIATVGLPPARDLDPDDFAESLWQRAVELTRLYAACLPPRS